MRYMLFEITIALMMLALVAMGRTQAQPPISTPYAVTATPTTAIIPPTPQPVYLLYLPMQFNNSSQ